MGGAVGRQDARRLAFQAALEVHVSAQAATDVETGCASRWYKLCPQSVQHTAPLTNGAAVAS